VKLSSHFTLDEFVASEVAERKGIDNTPPEEVLPVLAQTAQRAEHVRVLLRAPMHVNSGYRCLELNREIGSADTSQHRRGEALDFIAPRYGPPYEVCRAIALSDIAFDQLIYEFSWVHISFTTRRLPRRSVLTIRGARKWLGIVPT
jgi:hypothetical protein